MILTISEANRLLTETSNVVLKDKEIQGEVSSIKEAASGHAYITLVDNQTKNKKEGYLVITIWSSNYKERLQVGDIINITSLTFNSWEGKYSINVNKYTRCKSNNKTEKEIIEEQYNTLKEVGVFDIKRPLDISDVKSVGIITSTTGAVIQDIITTINRRGHAFKVHIYPAVMQGNTCVSSIIEQLNIAENNHDVIIIARGGGSKEDLAPFNSVELATRVSQSKSVIISAVGHETDFSFVDYASNIRAATPTAAAELVTVKGFTYHLDALNKLQLQLDNTVNTLKRNIWELETLVEEAIKYSLQELSILSLKVDALDVTKILDLDYCLLIDREGKIIDNSQSLQDLNYFQIIRKNEEATIGI